ncbi:hypothetical protein [Celerinatantimonas sp. MCCC 1A17872]|uniref:hypothetical protein n=1 Tax=Celerinatantimonas sp. MCCC 1A17872 TaxID=3177514 RepID=UPI0038C346E5
MNQHRLKGVVSIEFAMGFFFFMLMFFVWAQMAYAGYISGLIDYTLAETARDTRASIPSQTSRDEADSSTSQQSAYEIQFKTHLKEQAGVWANFIDFDKFHMNVYYYSSLDKLVGSCDDSDDEHTNDSSGNCLSNGVASSETDAPIAVYQASYDFTPLYNLFDSSSDLSLKREVFVVQEYERDKFYN